MNSYASIHLPAGLVQQKEPDAGNFRHQVPVIIINMFLDIILYTIQKAT
jgi:hypothetical protein